MPKNAPAIMTSSSSSLMNLPVADLAGDVNTRHKKRLEQNDRWGYLFQPCSEGLDGLTDCTPYRFVEVFRTLLKLPIKSTAEFLPKVIDKNKRLKTA